MTPIVKKGTPPVPSTLAQVVEELSNVNGAYRCRPAQRPLPSRDDIILIVKELRGILFPGYFGGNELRPEGLQYYVGHILDDVRGRLREQILRGLCFQCETPGEHCDTCEHDASGIIDKFVARLPKVRHLLETDVAAAYDGDPAATSPDEAIFCYPGITAITYCRLAHELYNLGVPLIPRIITEYAHNLTGIDIHPGAVIGESFFIDHGTGVVIGETARIGWRVRIYQGVTLGAKSFPLDENGKPIKGIDRHPKVEDDVIIYSGSTILGNVTIGQGSVIGGNVWLTASVPPGSRITQAQAVSESFENGSGI
ncbi:MAG: serine O-acetyltransferase EpsC [Candidatus Lernaella stagnicola]|nr:serine O-acetyltransferase EpsC [Candidatus Lernaella stagnicola]